MDRPSRAFLQEGWVIANHILVSFHVAFISSVLALPSAAILKGEVLQFIFVSPETLVSAVFLYVSFHCGIAFHELGHFVTAARLNALNDEVLRTVKPELEKPAAGRFLFYAKMFLRAPYGAARGIKREGLNYYPDAPYNLAVAAAGPRASRNVAFAALPPAVALLGLGLALGWLPAIYVGRVALGIGVVALLDFLLADPGKYREYNARERRAREKAAAVAGSRGWYDRAPAMRRRMLEGRIQEVTHPRLGPVTAPWQFRNCGMGGRHTEKEYPESNISMQEAMFLILGARDYQEGQEMTVRLQSRLKEIIEKAEGCRVMGIGLEGGLAPYVEKGSFPLPEVRLWSMMRQAIEECGYRPGEDVAIALDPAMTELEIAYREEFDMPDSVGMYLFWRDKAKKVMDRDAVLDIYLEAITRHEIPILSIEDGFSEEDHEGWKKLLETLGERIFVIGDDLVTTNDRTIELCTTKGLINTALIKANQIGSLYETLIAMLVALGKGLELVVSHRSKSPNDDMEAHFGLAANALGLKCGGGANTERLVKYQAVAELITRCGSADSQLAIGEDQRAVVGRVFAYEEPTNAGVPTVGATIELTLPEAGVGLRFRGATPLGTSAGTGEAIHLVDGMIEAAEHREVIERHPTLFRELEPGVFGFRKDVREARVRELGDEALEALFARAQRYDGKGCVTAVENVLEIIAPALTGRSAAALSLKDVDRLLLGLERRVAERRGKLGADRPDGDDVAVMQRKQNLGMNAMLSVSLAMARGMAHLRGKELYELLREEMISIISQLCRREKVAIEGSRLGDYVAALREANRKLEAEGRLLYEALRETTGIYRAEPDEPEEVAPAPPHREEPAVAAAPAVPAAPAAGEAPAEEPEAVRELSQVFYRAFLGSGSEDDRNEALRRYGVTKRTLTRERGRFGLANNRVFRAGERLVIPYLSGDEVVVHAVSGSETRTLARSKLAPGRILTDRFLRELGGFEGEAVDLEGELFDFDAERATPVRIARIRDLAAELKKINDCVNRNAGVHALRGLVARLSSLSFKAFLGAKNMQPEVQSLNHELVRFLNSPLARRVPLLARLLVRNASGLAAKPNLIDRLWNDTIELAEVHVRGSDLVNELRRSTHHALGEPTRELAAAYLHYLETGEDSELARLGHPEPGPADREARGRTTPVEFVRRIREDLEKFLGTTEVVERVAEWRASYAEALVRCEFGKSLDEEAAAVVADGIRAANPWVYLHHLRILKKKAEEFAGFSPEVGAAFRAGLDSWLASKPDESTFDAEATERAVRDGVAAFTAEIRAVFQDALFAALDEVLETHGENDHRATFARIRELRRLVDETIRRGGFRQQRYRLYQLDCLLEEMGFLALRHAATEYEQRGVQLVPCLEIVRTCIRNLSHDGLPSRALRDLGDLLLDGSRTHAEILNLLEAIQRNYHKLLQRVTAPYETMRERFGLSEDELRLLLGNMQRVMYDLNSMVVFTELARTHIRDHGADLDEPVNPGSAAGGDDGAFDVIHLSHLDAIRARVHDDDPGRNPRGCYGGKGSGLLYISHLGLPTRDGFILPAALPRSGRHRTDRDGFERTVAEHLSVLEQDLRQRDGADRRFGDPAGPLLLAVRGGSVFSMPGILATVVFLGMNDDVARTLAAEDPWHAWDSYRRFLASFARTVWDVDLETFDLVEETKRRYGVKSKDELPWEGMREIVQASKAVLREKGHAEMLEAVLGDPGRQLVLAIEAVFDSWESETARRYREIKGFSHTWHTAVAVQEMTFGNRKNEAVRPGLDETEASLTGVVVRTRMTDRGVRELEGDIKFSAAGDDLVAGVTTSESFRPIGELGQLMPMLDRRMKHVVARLRRYFGTDQELEFTVERGVLSVLQSRTAVSGLDLPGAAFADAGEPDTRGIGVRGGAFRGLAAFGEADLGELGERAAERDDVDGVVMVLENPTPEDLPAVLSADALLAARGGSTSHAAVAINGLERKCFSAVMSAAGLKVSARKGEAVLLDADGNVRLRIRRGDVVSLHGTTGEVYVGTRPLRSA